MTKVKFYAMLAAAAMLGGCYSYPPAPVAAFGESYTNRQKDGADEIFKNITSLSLADAQRIALLNNPTYIAAHHAVKAAHMRYLQSYSGYMPTISAGADYSGGNSWVMSSKKRDGNISYGGRDPRHPRTETNSFGVSVNASLLLFDGLIREFSVMEAQHAEKYYQHMDENACRTIAQAVAYAYNNVLLAIEKRRIALEDRKFQKTSLEDTTYKFDAGAVPLSDVLNFEILMNNAEASMISADYEYETSVYALAQLMGYPDGVLPVNVIFSGRIKPDYGELPAVEVYLDSALANRPDLKAYREQLEMSKYRLYQTYGSFSPTASAYFNYNFNLNESATRDTRSRSYAENTGISYGVNVDWVLFSGLARYNRMRESQANLAIAEFDVASQWFQVVNDVRTAYAAYKLSSKNSKIREKVRDLSAQQRDLVDDEYRAGNTELTRLNEAQRDYVTAESNLVSSYVNIQNAKAQLDAAVGVNTSEYYLNQGAADTTAKPAAAKAQESKAEAAAKPAAQAAPAKAPAANAPAIPASATAK